MENETDYGVTIDEETGEITGAASYSFDSDKAFYPDTEEKVNWVLSKILSHDSAVIAINNTEEVVRARAIIKNADDMARRHADKAQKLRDFFGPALKEYAKKQLDGKKERTFRTIFGSIALRSNPSRWKLVSESDAIRWAKKHGYGWAVRTVSKVLVSDILKSDKTALDPQNQDAAFKKAFSKELPYESVTITTGSSEQ